MTIRANERKLYNLLPIQTGYALPNSIYPNAAIPSEDGKWNYKKTEETRKATIRAKKHNLGILAHVDHILIPMELRFLTRMELPMKYCADLETNILYPPKHCSRFQLRINFTCSVTDLMISFSLREQIAFLKRKKEARNYFNPSARLPVSALCQLFSQPRWQRCRRLFSKSLS